MNVLRENFDSFESEMVRLHELANYAPPSIVAGIPEFFSSVNNWLGISSHKDSTKTVVLPDPSMNLSLPYPRDELSLAIGRKLAGNLNETLNELMHKYDLPIDVLNRPVTALSGGQRVLMGLIKASFLVKKESQLIVCSPFFWLDKNHCVIIQHLLDQMAQDGVQTYLLTLEGEEPIQNPILSDIHTPQELNWVLSLNNPIVVFPKSHFPMEIPEKRIKYLSSEQTLQFYSPTLLTGSNGIGKTAFAKLLAGLLKTDENTPAVKTSGYSGKPRLMMQDTVIHLFSQSPTSHLDRVFRSDKELMKKAKTLFLEMQTNCAEQLSLIDSKLSVGSKKEPNTILQAKLSLIAERLVDDCPLLILDEPGWCLSKTVAQVFLKEVVRVAHRTHTAVMIISHQHDWWNYITINQLHLIQGNTPEEVCLVKTERNIT